MNPRLRLSTLRTIWAAKVRRYLETRRALTHSVTEMQKADRRDQRRAALAVRALVGLLPEADKKLIRFSSAYAFSYGDTVTVCAVPRYGIEGLPVSELAERLRRRLIIEGCKATFGERQYAKWSETLELCLEIKGLAGIKTLSFHISSVKLGPDCTIEGREVTEVIPAQEEMVEVKTVKVAVCTDPVTQERKEIVLG